MKDTKGLLSGKNKTLLHQGSSRQGVFTSSLSRTVE
jgi:hypothetical protein